MGTWKQTDSGVSQSSLSSQKSQDYIGRSCSHGVIFSAALEIKASVKGHWFPLKTKWQRKGQSAFSCTLRVNWVDQTGTGAYLRVYHGLHSWETQIIQDSNWLKLTFHTCSCGLEVVHLLRSSTKLPFSHFWVNTILFFKETEYFDLARMQKWQYRHLYHKLF